MGTDYEKKKLQKSAYGVSAAGLEQALAVKNAKEREYTPRDQIVGSFGIVLPERGHRGRIFWKVSGHRKDKNLQFVNPAPHNPYCDSLFNSMFKGWK